MSKILLLLLIKSPCDNIVYAFAYCFCHMHADDCLGCKNVSSV